MRARTLVIATAISLASMSLVLIVAGAFMIRQFDHIESEQAEGKATQALRALEADLNQLAVSTRDYAEWDDAEQYARDRDPEFIRANFSFDSLDGMHVDVMALVDADGKLLAGAQLDRTARRLDATVGGEVQTLVNATRSNVAALRQRRSTQRITRLDSGLFAFCVVEISRSDHSNPTGAVLLFGRYLGDDVLQRMRHTSQLPIDLVSLDRLKSVPATATHVATWIAGTKVSADTDTAITDTDHITGYAVIRNLVDVPIALLSTSGPRAVGALGRRSTFVLLGAIATLTLACGTVLLVMLSRLRQHWTRSLAQRDQHRRILASLGEGIAVVDPADGRIIEVNDALLECIGYTREDLLNLNLAQVYLDIADANEVLSVNDTAAVRECRLRARDGRMIDTEISGTRMEEEDRALICVVTRDISQRRRAEENQRENQSRLAHLTEHDALTGLPNRTYLQNRLPGLLTTVAADERLLAMFYIDLDQFKQINDTYGHGIGDQVLRVIATRLGEKTRAEDIVLRTGGDEFIVVAPIETAGQTRELGQRLLACVRTSVLIAELNVTVTASIGVAIYPQDGLDSETLLKHADIALYQAKENGRDRCQAFSNRMNVELSEQLALEQALRRAIDTEQIHIHYQPIVDLHTGLVASFEALARWTHPEWGSIPPGRFIPVAEKTGMIVQLGEQVVREVMLQLHAWQRAGLTLAPIAVNVAPVQLQRSEFSTFVHEAAAEYDIDLSLLAFEITESALLQDTNKHVVIIDTLRHAGSRVYIDDFGTGFSNLSYLKTLPVDAVKIDQSFVRNIVADTNDAAIVGGIVTLARQLKLSTIAEGIETAEQAERLRALGCQLGQGYYFGKPMPAAQCRALLEQLGTSRRLTETVKTRAFGKVANQ